MGAKILIQPFAGDSAKCAADPTERLGKEFASYLAACRAAGFGFDRIARKQVGSLSALPTLVAELEKAGFAFIVDPALRDRLANQIKTVEDDDAVARARAGQAQQRAEAHGMRLLPFQLTGVRWLAHRKNGLLGDEMGLGKTVQSICSWPEGAPVLVVCPPIPKLNWAREVRKWNPSYRVAVLDGRASFRWPDPGEVVITNYDILPAVPQETALREKRAKKAAAKGECIARGMIERYMRAVGFRNLDDLGYVGKLDMVELTDAECESLWDSILGDDEHAEEKSNPPIPELPPAPPGILLVADEVHRLKNTKALRTIRWRAIKARAIEAHGRIYVMSGTPLINRPPELWQVLDAADCAHEAFGTWHNFVRLFNGYKGTHGWEWGIPDPQVAVCLRKVALVRRRADVMPDLPKKFRTDTVVELTPEARHLCDAVVAHIEARGESLDHLMQTLDQTAVAGASFELISKTRKAIAIALTGAAVERVEQYEEEETPVIVFSMHRDPIDVIGARPGWAKIVGGMDHAERDAIVTRFQAGELKGIAGTIQAMGEAVTLTHSHHGLFVDLAWTPALNNQAEDRMVRYGATGDKVTIERLIGNHALCYRVMELITIKQQIIEGSVDAAAVGAGSDQAALAVQEKLARVQAMAHIFDAPNAVDQTDVEAEEREREEARAEARAQARSGAMPTRRATNEELAALARARAYVNERGDPDPRMAVALCDYADRGDNLSDLEWAALARMMEHAR